MDSGTMTPMLKRMEKLGLLTRTRDRADERHVMVHLTPDGVALRTRAAEVPVALSGRIGDRLGPGAAEALRTAVRDLVDLLAADLANISGDPAPQAALPHSIK
nr:MarR family winged helix-turn-helix transcriptional regulator [Sulfitobacter sp. SK025]